MVRKTDVLICGSGSAGVCAAAWLARLGIDFTILDKRDGPLVLGQADGVQCRTVEVFESFGVSEEMLREGYHVIEVVFWSTDSSTGKLVRNGRTADTMPGLSHMPHVILNQARLNSLLLGVMRQAKPEQKVDYGYAVQSVEVDGTATETDSYPVTVTAVKDGQEHIFQAKYVLGCDGAHSNVRRALGYKMVGDSTDAVWGVMDVYPRTNFPDIRKKATLKSASGTLLIIPREGGSLVRFYIELPHGTNAKDVKLEDLQSAAQAIFAPYTMDYADTFWWSAYAIGQRLADHFTKANRVFLTGDACHTHSPKAGQGMNVSLQDGYNMGWKLAQVLKGQSGPELLETYDLERGKVAADLIDFDRSFAKLFAAKPAAGDNGAAARALQEGFIKAGRYTAGLTATYEDSMLTSAKQSTQMLANNVPVGMRFPSARVVRLADAKAMQLVRALPADGRWRIVIFAGEIGDPTCTSQLQDLAAYISSPDGPVHRHTTKGEDIDSFIEPIVVFSGQRTRIEQGDIPEYFQPVTGKWQMRDVHKIFVDDESYNSGHGHAYEKYGIDTKTGAIIIVRPDHYVSMVTSVNDFNGIGSFFAGFARDLRTPDGVNGETSHR